MKAEINRNDLPELRKLAALDDEASYVIAENARSLLAEAAPELTAYENRFWIAFGDLTSERTITLGGAGPIPRSAIREYSYECDHDDAQRMVFKRVIGAMDQAYLEEMRAKDDKASKSSK